MKQYVTFSTAIIAFSVRADRRALSGAASRRLVRGFRSVALLTALLSSTSVYAQAVTNNWATWVLPSSYGLSSIGTPLGVPLFKYAAGATGRALDPLSGKTFNFTLSGEVAGMSLPSSTAWASVWPPGSANPYLSAHVTSSPSGSAFIAQTGYTEDQYKAHSLTFSAPVKDLIYAVWSLGRPTLSSTLKFSQPFQILSTNKDGIVDLLTSSGDATVGYSLTGEEGNGVIQFLGEFTTLNWVVTAPEYYGVFNFGFTNSPFVSPGPVPGAYAFPPGELPTPFGVAVASTPTIPDITTGAGNLFASVNSAVTTVFDGGTLTNDASATTNQNFTITAKGGTIDAAGYVLTFTGVISDKTPGTPGALTIKSGSAGGNVILTGVNTYTGATTIDPLGKLSLSGSSSIAESSGVAVDGTFDISETTSGASVKAISGAGSIELGARTLMLTNASGTFSGTIGGVNGGLAIAPGSQTLTGANTYTGTTTVASGAALSIGDGGTTGSIGDGAVDNAGTLTLNRSNDYTFANALSGGGALTITGGGTTTITSPTGTVGVITVTGNTTAFFNSGSLNNSSHAEIVALDANLAPQLVFSGASLSVASGSTLRGAGYVNAPTTINGTLRSGNSPGTIVFGDSVTQFAGSVLALDIDGPGTGAGAGNYSSVIVNGLGHTYTLDGTVQPFLRNITGSANNTYSPEVGSIFTVISATGGVLGSFTGITQPMEGLLPNTQFDSIYNTNTFQLVITTTNMGGIAGLTPNEKAVGDALQAVRPMPGVRRNAAEAAVYGKLYQLPLMGYGPAYGRIGFAIYGDALMGQSDAAGLMASTVGDQMAQRRGTSMAADGKSRKYCLDGDKLTTNPKDCRQLTLWGAAVGQFGRTYSTLGDPGYKSDNRGVMVGADVEIQNNVRFGAFAGHTAGSVDSSRTTSSAALETYAVGAYAAADGANVYVNGLAAYVGGDQNVRRNPLGTQVSAKPKVTGAVFSLELGTRLTFDDFIFEPHAGLKATSMRRVETTETGATPLSATISGDSINTALATAGVRAIMHGKLRDGTAVSAVARAAYGRELGAQGTNVSGVFSELNTAAIVSSSRRGRDAFLGGLTMGINLSKGADIFARYDVEVRKNANSQSFSAGLRISW